MSESTTLNIDNGSKSKPSSPVNASNQNIINSNALPSQNTYNDNIGNDHNLLRFSNSYSSNFIHYHLFYRQKIASA